MNITTPKIQFVLVALLYFNIPMTQISQVYILPL
jgi:hypothetical protein